MAASLIEKLTNFLMPVEDETIVVEDDLTNLRERKSRLHLHAARNFKIVVVQPRMFDDVQVYADYLRSNTAVMVNFQDMDDASQQRICDFLQGVCAVTGSNAQRISSNVLLYVPEYAEVKKELFAYSVPTYIKKNHAL